MERDGLVCRSQRDGNRRSLYVSLTPQGRDLAQQMEQIFRQADAQASAQLTPQELRAADSHAENRVRLPRSPPERGGSVMETAAFHTLLKRYGMFFVGLVIMSFGIACSIKAELGTSPVSSLPFVLSQFTPLSVGIASVLVNATLILLQILLLRRQYDPIQLIQLPVALAFGFLTDFSVWVLQDITCSSYLTQWMLCICGILLVGIGVSFEVTANVVTLAGEGMVLAICKVFP